MKLGLKIEITNEGAGSSVKTLNSTISLEKYASASRSFIKDVFPVRDDLRKNGIDPFFSLDESERSVIFLRFLGPHGFLICISQARPENSGRPYDGAAAWIHVPASVALSGKETEKLIDDVEEALSNKKGIDNQRLDTIFAKDYEERNVIPAISTIVSKGESSGVRYYGSGTDYELYELLGNGIAQPEYSKFKSVFLLRKSESIYFTGQEIITQLVPTCTIAPPTPMKGFSPYLENEIPFSLSIEVPQKSPVKIVWKKTGYQDIERVIEAIATDVEKSNKLFAIHESEVKFAVLKDWFNVYSNHNPLKNYHIQVDNQDFNNKGIVYLLESKIKTGVHVKVVAEGFNTFEKDIQLSKNVEITMIPIMHHYRFSIPMYDGKESIKSGDLKLEVTRKLKKSPLRGYSLEGDYLREGEEYVNFLKRDIKGPIKYFAFGFAACFLIMLLCAGWNAMEDYNFKFGWPPFEKNQKKESRIVTQEKVVVKKQPEVNKDSINAIAYLDRESTWCKDSLESYKLTKGLFESLNNLDVNSLKTKWSEKLKGSSQFKNISEHAGVALERKYNLKLTSKNNRYNKNPDDTKISVENYLKWIGENHFEENNKAIGKADGSKIKSSKDSSSKSQTNKNEGKNKSKRGGI